MPKAGLVRGLVMERVGPVLFDLSCDHVGDLAETVALIWPPEPGANRVPPLGEPVEKLSHAGKSELPALLARLFDAMGTNERWATIKLITGGLRVGVSARLAKAALAAQWGCKPDEIEEVWHAVESPHEELFAWLEGRGFPTRPG